VCCSLPDGTTIFTEGRRPVGAKATFDAGDLRVEVVRAMEELSLNFETEALLVDDAHNLTDPVSAQTHSQLSSCRIELSLGAVSPPFDDWPERAGGDEEAAGGYELLTTVAGHVSVGGTVFLVDGFGIREHSWGNELRSPRRYSWLAGNAGPTFGFAARETVDQDGDTHAGGFVWDGTSLVDLDNLEMVLPGAGGDSSSPCEAVMAAGRRRWRVQGRPLLTFPLPAGASPLSSRSATLWRWTLDDGRVGYGPSEVSSFSPENAPAPR
jgi:hypothetical protein